MKLAGMRPTSVMTEALVQLRIDELCTHPLFAVRCVDHFQTLFENFFFCKALGKLRGNHIVSTMYYWAGTV